MHEITSQIKEKAIQLGFSKVGIAQADELTDAKMTLQKWLDLGYHGTMDWMERYFEKRVDPRELVPGAKSIISLALNYYTPEMHSDDPDKAKISRYAWGDDYHDIMKKKLYLLFDAIKDMAPEANGRVFVDTAPIMDKLWAVQAGIGWQGKHSNVITREMGSWVFLGEIVINLELDYDEPIRDYCGTCNLCIEACPTDAIVQPYMVDSNLCISYLTIELRDRGNIPDTLAPKMDNWVFGCDICQDVCPWNIKFKQNTHEQSFFPREGNVSPELIDLAEMPKEDFNRQFRKSPVKRPKWEGFLRNVMTILKHKKQETNIRS